jgi:hypothetical protein
MSWIRSDQALLRHPKTILLKALLKIDMDAVVGRLHFLWWWCLDYALDGDLSKHDPKVIEEACNIPMKTLYRAGFVDSRPYRRIHDWWDNQGNYLKLRFRDHPDKWMQIRDLYHSKSLNGEHMGTLTSKPLSNPVDVDLHTDVRTDVKDVRTSTSKEKARFALASLVAPLPLAPTTKIEAEEEIEFGHEDFQMTGWRKTEIPTDSFGWDHLERSLDNVERVQSKTREKFYKDRKWN